MVILNAGSGAWAFEPLAEHLSRVLGVPVSEEPAAYFYLLSWDGPEPPPGASFIPYPAIVQASDKRLLAETIHRAGVATPRTHLLETPAEVDRFLRAEPATSWVLKYPTGCGGAGHRLLDGSAPVPEEWPRPYVVQEFVRLERPEVYRLYSAGGETFGWNVRRFPTGVAASPWVAHARGARYQDPGPLPAAAEEQARAALAATGLLDSFGCADLLHAGDGRWLVLEVGTDGVFNHVDRDVDLPGLSDEIDRRIAAAFLASQPA